MGIYDPNADNGPVAKPWLSMDCWAQKRSYSGSLMAQFVGCSKPHRKGFLTCHWHRDREAAAQRLAQRLTTLRKDES